MDQLSNYKVGDTVEISEAQAFNQGEGWIEHQSDIFVVTETFKDAIFAVKIDDENYDIFVEPEDLEDGYIKLKKL